jgi:hypothetical protein
MMQAMQSYETQLNADLNWALLEGSMFFEGTSGVQCALNRLVENLNRLGIDYAIAGGMALFFHGYRRFTEDVDVLVTPAGLEAIHAALDGLGYVRPFEQSKNLRDTQSGVRIDFLVSGQYPGDGKPGPVAFPLPATASETLEGTQVLQLPRLVELKLASGKSPGRLKDLADVQELIRGLNLGEDYCTQLEPSVRETYLQLWRDSRASRQDE